jgi:hypothetical protein
MKEQMLLKSEQGETGSSNVQLERLELAACGVAPRTCRRPAPCVFTDKHIHAFLTKTADALCTCIAVS